MGTLLNLRARGESIGGVGGLERPDGDRSATSGDGGNKVGEDGAATADPSLQYSYEMIKLSS